MNRLLMVLLCLLFTAAQCSWAEDPPPASGKSAEPAQAAPAEADADTAAIDELPPSDEPGAEAADSTPKLTVSDEPFEISTDMEGMDSLDVLPSEMITSFDGGTRRITLERSVFRRERPIRYESANRRDPFKPLIREEKGEVKVQTELLQIDGAVLKGVVWSEGQYLAMIKDKNAKTFFLREGDRIYNGRVLMVTQSMVTLEISDFGDYQQVTLKITGPSTGSNSGSNAGPNG